MCNWDRKGKLSRCMTTCLVCTKTTILQLNKWRPPKTVWLEPVVDCEICCPTGNGFNAYMDVYGRGCSYVLFELYMMSEFVPFCCAIRSLFLYLSGPWGVLMHLQPVWLVVNDGVLQGIFSPSKKYFVFRVCMFGTLSSRSTTFVLPKPRHKQE